MPNRSSAVPDASVFGVEQGSVEWKRAEMEEWLAAKATASLAAFIPADEFKVKMRVTFKEAPKVQKSITNVSLGLLGTVAVLESGGPKPKPELGLFAKISRIDVSLVVSDRVSETTAVNMSRLIQQGVPVVKPENIKVEVLRLEAPKLTWVDWVEKFKFVIGLLGLAALFWLAMYYILPRIRFQTAIKLGPAQAAESPRVEALPYGKLRNAMMIPLEMMTPEQQTDTAHAAEPPATGDLLDSLLPQTLTAVELRRLRSLAMTLSIKECLDLIRADVGLGSVLVNLLPNDKTTSILSQLPPSTLEDLRKATLDWDAESLARQAGALMDAVREFRGNKMPRAASGEKLRVFVEQVGPENESAVFADLIRMEKFEELAQLAHKSPPAELLGQFPFEALFAAFERLNFKEKAKVLALCPKEMAERLVPTKSLESVHPALRSEMDRIKNDPQAVEKAQAAWNKFLQSCRAAVESNPRWQQILHPAIEAWLWNVSRGVVGTEASIAKRKNRGDAA